MRLLTTVLASLTVASLIAFAGFWLGRAGGERAVGQPKPERAAENATRVGEDPRLAAMVGRLEQRLAAMEARQALALPSASASAAPVPEGPAAEAEPFDRAKEEARESERLAAVQTAFQSEPRDPAWASPSEVHLHAAVDAAVEEGAKFAIKSVKCLTSVCQMVLSAPGPDELKYLTHQLAHKITGMGSLDLTQPTVGPDGSAAVTCHLFRQGYPRPDEGVM